MKNSAEQITNSETKASMDFWSSNDGEYLLNGNCFENELLKEFNYWNKAPNRLGYILILDKYLQSRKGEYHDQDLLRNLFHSTNEDIVIDFNFAKSLNIFEVIYPNCFTCKTEAGKALIELSYDLRFIVSKKNYITKENINIEFEVCHADYVNDCHKSLITGNTPF